MARACPGAHCGPPTSRRGLAASSVVRGKDQPRPAGPVAKPCLRRQRKNLASGLASDCHGPVARFCHGPKPRRGPGRPWAGPAARGAGAGALAKVCRGHAAGLAAGGKASPRTRPPVARRAWKPCPVPGRPRHSLATGPAARRETLPRAMPPVAKPCRWPGKASPQARAPTATGRPSVATPCGGPGRPWQGLAVGPGVAVKPYREPGSLWQGLALPRARLPARVLCYGLPRESLAAGPGASGKPRHSPAARFEALPPAQRRTARPGPPVEAKPCRWPGRPWRSGPSPPWRRPAPCAGRCQAGSLATGSGNRIGAGPAARGKALPRSWPRQSLA